MKTLPRAACTAAILLIGAIMGVAVARTLSPGAGAPKKCECGGGDARCFFDGSKCPVSGGKCKCFKAPDIATSTASLNNTAAAATAVNPIQTLANASCSCGGKGCSCAFDSCGKDGASACGCGGVDCNCVSKRCPKFSTVSNCTGFTVWDSDGKKHCNNISR